jgi:hypothetical protein
MQNIWVSCTAITHLSATMCGSRSRSELALYYVLSPKFCTLNATIGKGASCRGLPGLEAIRQIPATGLLSQDLRCA